MANACFLAIANLEPPVNLFRRRSFEGELARGNKDEPRSPSDPAWECMGQEGIHMLHKFALAALTAVFALGTASAQAEEPPARNTLSVVGTGVGLGMTAAYWSLND